MEYYKKVSNWTILFRYQNTGDRLFYIYALYWSTVFNCFTPLWCKLHIVFLFIFTSVQEEVEI